MLKNFVDNFSFQKSAEILIFAFVIFEQCQRRNHFQKKKNSKVLETDYAPPNHNKPTSARLSAFFVLKINEF